VPAFSSKVLANQSLLKNIIIAVLAVALVCRCSSGRAISRSPLSKGVVFIPVWIITAPSNWGIFKLRIMKNKGGDYMTPWLIVLTIVAGGLLGWFGKEK
jgi:hypothetical protein